VPARVAFAVPRGAFFDAIRWRSLFALGLLADAPSDDIDAARAEWGKFEWILAAKPRMAPRAGAPGISAC
jgi:hypothetical protein